MFGLGLLEVLVLLVLAFLVFGPQQFPTVVRNFVKLLNELRLAFTEMKSDFYDVKKETEKHFQQLKGDIKKDLKWIEELPKGEEITPPSSKGEDSSPEDNRGQT